MTVTDSFTSRVAPINMTFRYIYFTTASYSSNTVGEWKPFRSWPKINLTNEPQLGFFSLQQRNRKVIFPLLILFAKGSSRILFDFKQCWDNP